MATEHLTARRLMRSDLVTIEADRTVREVMETLASVPEDDRVPRILVVIDGEGRYEGMITAKLLLRSLLALWSPERAVREDPVSHEKSLLSLVEDRRTMRVHDALVRGLPVAAPDERILALISHVVDTDLEFLPVVEDGRAIGLVPVTEIFYATAGLVLTPDDEGIRLDV